MAKKGGDGEEPDYAVEVFFMKKKIEVLQYRLMMKDEQTASSHRSEDALRARTAELDRQFEEEHERCKENTGEMSRQYREMQESFNERIDVLQQHVAQAKQEIESVTREIDLVRVEKDEIIRKKDAEIKSLSQKMETMAFEFADMLKETLDKMSQRIEVTHNSWDRDSGKPPLMNRLKEFSLNELPPPNNKE
jgi:predicted RNase H-like nuclease (RuvC/YqgF family)